MRTAWGIGLGLLLVLGVDAVAGAADAPRNLDDYVLLGIQSAKVGNGGFVDSGDVGVNNAVVGSARKAGLACGKRVFIRDSAAADQAKMSTGSSVCDLFTNDLVSAISSVNIRCSGPTTFAPLPLIDPLPPLPAFTPGTESVRVFGGQTLVLDPGAYGNVSVLRGGTLELTGGTYQLANLKAARLGKILVDTPSTINIQGGLRVGTQGVFGPTTSSVGPRQIKVNVGGPVAGFTQNAHAAIDLYAPNATLHFGRSSELEGRFIGKDNRCDKHSTFRHPQCGDSILDPGEQCDPPGSASAACNGEVCKDGCTCPFCGDGSVDQTAEQCDPPGSSTCGGGSLDCLQNCQCPRCGDGMLDVPGEECDPPGQPSPACNGQACGSDCTCPPPPIPCGNGHLDPGEQCDPPGSPTCPSSSPGGGFLDCLQNCQCPVCGDNIRQDGEQCDGSDASNCPSGSCKPDCTCDPCGDGMLGGSEVCDPPGAPAAACEGQACLPGCVCPECGDGVRNQPNEQCDGNDDSACPGKCQPNCLCPPPAEFCSLTQGAYGAPGGAANGPSGAVTSNPSILPVTVGAPGILSLKVTDQTRLICFMPTGGTPAALCTGLSGCGGDMVINACSNPPILDFDSSGNGSSGGQGGGTLTGQTIAAKLNVALSDLGATPTGLRGFVLPTALCTTKGTFMISPNIADGVTTVAGLLVLADQALSDPSAFTGPPITRSDINGALNAINVGFDQCATVVPCL